MSQFFTPTNSINFQDNAFKVSSLLGIKKSKTFEEPLPTQDKENLRAIKPDLLSQFAEETTVEIAEKLGCATIQKAVDLLEMQVNDVLNDVRKYMLILQLPDSEKSIYYETEMACNNDFDKLTK